VFDEAEIVPHDDYQMNLSGGPAGAHPVMSEGAEEEEFLGTIRRNDENALEEDPDCDSQNNGSVIHNSDGKEKIVDESPSKAKKGGKLAEDEIIRLINEKYLHEESSKDVSIVYKDNKVFD
jgi:hypothetical protein